MTFSARVPGVRLYDGQVWDPLLFNGMASVVTLNDTDKVSLEDAGVVVFEGLRIGGALSVEGHLAPLYRPSNIGVLVFRMSDEHWLSPGEEGIDRVRPGDVVVTKFPPIRTAWATTCTYRHPVDANCAIIRSLSPAMGFWVAVCLNQAPYTDYLLRISGAAVLPRVRSSALRELRVPEPSPEVTGLALRCWELLDAQQECRESLTRLSRQVNTYIAEQADAAGWADAVAELTAPTWSGFIAPVDLQDSLVVKHVLLARLRHKLAQQAGWRPLCQYLAQQQPAVNRLGELFACARYLRLSDVAESLSLHPAPGDEPVQIASRVYGQPLGRDEILLSTLATDTKVLFAGEAVPHNTFVTDNWARLAFQDTPAAWALVLTTPQVQMQLRLMAMGSVQQFARREDIDGLMLPEIPLDQRMVWDREIRRLQQRQREVSADLANIWQQAVTLFHEVHATGYQAARISKEAWQARRVG